MPRSTGSFQCAGIMENKQDSMPRSVAESVVPAAALPKSQSIAVSRSSLDQEIIYMISLPGPNFSKSSMTWLLAVCPPDIFSF